jgi:hypothetical protein
MIEMRAPEQASTTELIQDTRREITQFLHKQPTGDSRAFELFRRAITLRDEQARSGIYELYSAVASSWILRLTQNVMDQPSWIRQQPTPTGTVPSLQYEAVSFQTRPFICRPQTFYKVSIT